MPDGSATERVPELGELAVPVTLVPADLPVGEFEAQIRADPDSLGAVAHAGGELFVLDRTCLETVFAGRLGSGRAVLHRRPVRAILIDLDRFREINDAFGHGSGDDLLQGCHFGRPLPAGRLGQAVAV